ncbi:uncharacterized protein LOC131876360 [Cryptomeria japonica]|uniref:uncharacterized protein LOC131876360 n=1 Tax=Cryptomeria japonica TaxID=3369 RepID=UPI0027DA22A0|nr:uncharacterized protein LOC131876360 [Cryptomeria japonica]
MSSEKSSRCEALRKAGNEIYSQVRDGCYGSCVLRLRLGKALNLYEEALKAAGHDKSERASSYKNLAAANWLWGKSEWQIYMQGSDGSSEALQAIRATKERISKSLKFYLLAFELGESGTKPEIWLTQLQETIGDKIIGWVTEQIDASGVCFEPILVDLCAQLENGRSNTKRGLAALFYMFYVSLIFNQGFKYITSEDEG